MSRFKKIRDRLKMTQRAMGLSLGCSQGNISFYEKGQTVKPEVAKRLILLAEKKGIPVSYEDIYGPVDDGGNYADQPKPRA